MGKAYYRSPLIQEPNKWHNVGNTWEYGNYRYLYLTIRKLDNNKFKPCIGSQADIPYPGHDLPKSGYFEYDTLEEAKKHLFEYTDYIRDFWDKDNKQMHNRNLHHSRPDVYPA